ncbi:hypothetical protein ACH4E8_24250 [Streptomyces sp. NPDC017979]|uniref:hypothetical protein n=1 Tax=Streptomyces sp. NPDC017979 TaxID=3365024 RepID=UPI003789AF09
MDAGSRITLAVGIVTAAVALIGYWINQRINRREAKMQMYTEALQVIHHYEELPYAIRHRQGSDAEVRAALAEKISDVFARLNYHQTLLTMDSPVVGEAYAVLFARARRYGGPHRREAWNTAPVSSDAEMPAAAYFPYEHQPELEACLLAMRNELTPWGWVRRRRIRGRLRALQEQRPPVEPAWMRQRRERMLSADE